MDPAVTALAAEFQIPEAWAIAVVATARTVGADPRHLARVIAHESRFNPQAQYGYPAGPPGGKFLPGRATGLIQFIPSTAARLGTSTEALFEMNFFTQMNIVRRYLLMVAAGEWTNDEPGLLDTQEKVALAVFYPAYRHLPPETPLPASARAANPGINTIGDYVRRVLGGPVGQPVLPAAPAPARAPTVRPWAPPTLPALLKPPSLTSGPSTLVIAGASLVAAAMIYLAATQR